MNRVSEKTLVIHFRILKLVWLAFFSTKATKLIMGLLIADTQHVIVIELILQTTDSRYIDEIFFLENMLVIQLHTSRIISQYKNYLSKLEKKKVFLSHKMISIHKQAFFEFQFSAYKIVIFGL